MKMTTPTRIYSWGIKAHPFFVLHLQLYDWSHLSDLSYISGKWGWDRDDFDGCFEIESIVDFQCDFSKNFLSDLYFISESYELNMNLMAEMGVLDERRYEYSWIAWHSSTFDFTSFFLILFFYFFVSFFKADI